MRHILKLLLALVLVMPTAATAQAPKRGSGIVTGVVVSPEEACGFSELCMRSGKYFYDFTFERPQAQVVTGGAIFPGARVRVIYKRLSPSEQNVGTLWAGVAVSVAVLPSESSSGTPRMAVANTTWTLLYQSGPSDPWDEFGEIAFASDGRIEEVTPETGYRCRGGRWRLEGGQLQIDDSRTKAPGTGDCSPPLVHNLGASLAEAEFVGYARLGMNPRDEVRVRLIRKSAGAPSAPRPRSPASASFALYEDPNKRYVIAYPAGWKTQIASDQRTVAFLPAEGVNEAGVVTHGALVNIAEGSAFRTAPLDELYRQTIDAMRRSNRSLRAFEGTRRTTTLDGREAISEEFHLNHAGMMARVRITVSRSDGKSVSLTCIAPEGEFNSLDATFADLTRQFRWGGRAPVTTAQSPVIGTLDNTNGRYLDGCGCYFVSTGPRPRPDDAYLLVDYGDPAQAWMLIDGKVVVLRETANTMPSAGRPGAPFRLEYQAAGIRVEVRGTLGPRAGETRRLTTEIAVTKGGRTASVRATGACGC